MVKLFICKYSSKYLYIICYLLIVLGIWSFDNTVQIKGQLGSDEDDMIAMPKNTSTLNSSRLLHVAFDSIKINNDHDLLFPAEWVMDVYVNNQSISLLKNTDLIKAEDGKIIIFKNKTVNVIVPLNKPLRILTLGVEFDEKIRDNLPNISGILDSDLSLLEYKDRAEKSIISLISMDRNDAIGIIAKEFTKDNNFGIGKHNDCSESSGEAGDLYDTVDTNCDFLLEYTIK